METMMMERQQLASKEREVQEGFRMEEEKRRGRGSNKQEREKKGKERKE